MPAAPPMPTDLPSAEALAIKAHAENFPVALRLLPQRVRRDLTALYGFARLADDLGDEYPGNRLDALDWLEADLIAAIVGQASHPAVARLTPMLREHAESFGLFRDLISANRRDQQQLRYESFDELLDYCSLSANPVGRLVLGIFGQCGDDLVTWSDDVCSGLQIVEHLQDVAEDFDAGRVYLPQEDLAKFGCCDADLGRPIASPDVRRLLSFEADRARALLDSGSDLIARLPWQPRVAVAGFVAGGMAALDAVAAADFDVRGRAWPPSNPPRYPPPKYFHAPMRRP